MKLSKLPNRQLKTILNHGEVRFGEDEKRDAQLKVRMIAEMYLKELKKYFRDFEQTKAWKEMKKIRDLFKKAGDKESFDRINLVMTYIEQKVKQIDR